MSSVRDEILDWAGSNPTIARTLSAASKLDRLEDDVPGVRFAIVRNITLEPGLPAAIKLSAARAGIKAAVELGNFDALQEEVFGERSFLYAGSPDVIVLALHLQVLAPRLVLGFSSLSPQEVDKLTGATVARVLSLVKAIRERSSALILVHNFSLPIGSAAGILEGQSPQSQRNTIRRLNLELTQHVAAVKASYVVDVDYQLSLGGYEASFDDRYWHIGRAPYSFAFIQRLADEYVKYACALTGRSKKCLVLDCDNTLWGGVIGEEGINGIALGETSPGSAYLEFQATILDLAKRGVLLAINSKNNLDDALGVLQSHPNCLLRPEHFVAMKINWREKALNLRDIARELNIGLDSLVFVDDSAFECQRIREELPEVTVVQLPEDPSRYARTLRTLGLFDTLTVSDEDRRRTAMYRSEQHRAELAASLSSMDEYLKSLEMVLTIALATPFSIPRIAQLTQKTNQFNLTTRRYSEGDIERMAAGSEFHVYCAELQDRFDKAGIIAVAIVRDEGARAVVDTFLMSCRVIGRGVEQAVLEHVARDARQRGRSTLAGEYLATAKNGLVKEFFPANGFAPAADQEKGSWWEFDLSASLPQRPDWFKAVEAGPEVVPV